MSDHCVVDFTLSFDILENNNSTSNDEGYVFHNVEYKYVWNSEKVDQYHARLSSEETLVKLTNPSHNVNSASCNVDIDACFCELSCVIDVVVSPFLEDV